MFMNVILYPIYG